MKECTTHFACDCILAENEKLKRAVEVAEQSLTHISMLDNCEDCESSGHIHIAEQALKILVETTGKVSMVASTHDQGTARSDQA